jgi:hypothetical protein
VIPTPEPYVLEPLPAFREYPQNEMVERARAFYAQLQRRRMGVAAASITPIITSGNLNAPVTMIVERAAAFIRYTQ